MAVKVNLKSGPRDVEFDSVEESPGDGGHWRKTTDAGTGHDTYTAVAAGADVTAEWGANDVQTHTDVSLGTTAETWIDAAGKRHLVIREKL